MDQPAWWRHTAGTHPALSGSSTSRGASQDEFDLSLVGELEVNPTLLHLLTTDFECKLDLDELLDQVDIEGAIDTPQELIAVNAWLAERAAGVPGFSTSPRIILGTFSYAKLPMVNDLEASLDAMIDHELIAAIAGDKAAQAALRERQAKVDATDPNYVPLADEFLVLDTDASQNYVINAVLGGQDLISRSAWDRQESDHRQSDRDPAGSPQEGSVCC